VEHPVTQIVTPSFENSVFWDFNTVQSIEKSYPRMSHARNQQHETGSYVVICSPETSVHSQRTTFRYIPEDKLFTATAVRISNPITMDMGQQAVVTKITSPETSLNKQDFRPSDSIHLILPAA
jgi:hypothetical protein